MSFLNKFVDKIYVINTKFQLNKWENCLYQFNKYDIKNYERVEKITVNIHEYKKHDFIEKDYKIGKGMLGCKLSHIKCIQMGIKNNLDKILILEDDFQFINNVNYWFNKIKSYIKSDWDILYLGGRHKKWPIEINKYLVRSLRTYCAYAYIINSKCYKDLLDMIENSNEQIDVIYSKFNKNFICYSLKPYIVYQNNTISNSEIELNKIGNITTSYSFNINGKTSCGKEQINCIKIIVNKYFICLSMVLQYELQKYNINCKIIDILEYKFDIEDLSLYLIFTPILIELKNIPVNIVIFNTEPLTQKLINIIKNNSYILLLEYSKYNQKLLPRSSYYLPFGYSKLLEKIYQEVPNKEYCIDVLFYGAKSPRRQYIINNLIDKGVNVKWVREYNIKKLTTLIKQSKIVLIIHYHSNFKYRTNDLFRAGYLITNKKCIVHEITNDIDLDKEMSQFTFIVEYDKIISTILSILDNKKYLDNTLLNKGYNWFKNKYNYEQLLYNSFLTKIS